MTQTTCSIEGCEKARWARGWCSAHWRRWRIYGDPEGRAFPPAEERLWSRIDRDGPIVHPDLGRCWVWTGRLANGYGTLSRNGKTTPVHRFAYELTIGPIPPGLELDHLCRNRACVNPAHLEPVTRAENGRRGVSPAAVNARKTHCNHGHEFTPENTYRKKDGSRICRECTRRRDKEARTDRPKRERLEAERQRGLIVGGLS